MYSRPGLFILALSSATAALAVPQSMDPTYLRARPIEPMQPMSREPIGPVAWAAQAFGHCVSSRLHAIDATLAPEIGAASLMSACAAQLQGVQREAERVIAAARWTDAQKDRARAELRARLALVEQLLSARISANRSRTASLSH